MEALSDEPLEAILRFVPPLDLLRSTTYVSKRFAGVIGSDEFWRTHPASAAIKEYKGFPKLTKHQHQLYHIFLACRKEQQRRRQDAEGDVNEDEVLPAFLGFGSVLTSRAEAQRFRLASQQERRTCAATSTDHWNELAENLLFSPTDDGAADAEQQQSRAGDATTVLFRLLRTLRDNQRDNENDNVTWWSSKPSRDQNSSDTLLFTTNCALALMSDVKIKALTDPFLARAGVTDQVYTWNQTIVRAYRVPMGSMVDPSMHEALAGFPCSFLSAQPLAREEMMSHEIAATILQGVSDAHDVPSDQDSIDRLLQNATLVHESTFDDTVGSDELKLAFKTPVLANAITVTLVGKNFEQRPGSGYFACVESLDCSGMPLYESPDHAQSVRRAREMRERIESVAP